MKIKSRILSLFLAVVMVTSVFAAIPPFAVWAEDGTVPGAVTLSPIESYSTSAVTLRGKITANGGSEIKRYGFQYGIVGGSTSETKEWSGHLTTGKEVEFELTGLQPNTTIWYYFYAVNSTGTAKDASDRDEVVNGTQYASTLPEIELDAPSINSPDEDDTFYAGEDITFKWGTVSDAEGFQWELYESSTNYLDKLIDDGSISGTTSSKRKITIDGDTFKVGYSYKFKVRAYCGDVYSKWDSISIHIDISPELIADVEELSFEADGGTGYIDLTSSHQWTATASKKWIHLSPDGGTSNKKITVYVDENAGEQRTGFITIESDIGSIIVT
ncbi:MAG: BACON domain-containing protein, partial [Clostridia bacterium]|nr:BACON domain-containing protein [Clostridia bacterium]